MASSWVDLSTLHNPTSNIAPPATWGDQIRENQQHLYERIERVIAHTVLGAAAASIDSGALPTVPNGWRLRIVTKVQSSAGTGVLYGVRFNGDNGTNYVVQHNNAQNGTSSIAAATALTYMYFGGFGNESTNRWSQADGFVYDYLGSQHKVVNGQNFYPGNASTTMQLTEFGGLWASTAAITSVSLIAGSGNFVAGSSLTVLATPVPV